ncbi:FRG domain-containing protein [Silvibacterium sp.]|uniref:FRG domain-containing protein n=1 Tax=Silvibacterium sp. TaxID=1964179 RepID=UPI0039E64697
MPSQANTAVTLFRGQMHGHPLLPKLFRGNTPEIVLKNEVPMLDYLKSQARYLHPSTPDNDWNWISLGQHYGMSTRMSDWSENPLVALFFAVEEDRQKNNQPLVFHYPVHENSMLKNEDFQKISPFGIPHTRVIKVGHHSHRSEAQAAWQVVHAIHNLDKGSPKFYALENMDPHNVRITKIFIDPERVAFIREELSRWGIRHSTIYGDFGWVCRSIAPTFGLS